jgi:hypothetical protein
MCTRVAIFRITSYQGVLRIIAKNNSIFLRCRKKAKGKRYPVLNELSTMLRMIKSIEIVGVAPVFLNL